MCIERVSVTDKARAVIEQLREQHGDLIFHQSGGCCDGSSPMCFQKGDFLAPDQFEYCKNMHITVDVTPGRGSSFSLEIPLGVRFIAISRLFEEEELSQLRPIES